jgi:uncharacterized protein (DUF4415 family)
MKEKKHGGKTPNPELIDEENPEITPEELRRARPAAEVLPELIGDKAAQELLRRGRGRPQKEGKKVSTTVRLDPDVLEAFQQEGKGWQTRINQVLREHMPKREK